MELIPILLISLGGVLGGILAYYSKDSDVSLDRNVGDKLNELPKIYERAREAIKVATDFDKRFFDDPRVKKGIEKAISNGAKVKFLCERDPPEWYEKQKGMKIKRVKKLPSHIMIIDDRHVRLERPHEPLNFGKAKEDVAFIFKDFPRLAKKYSERFDDLWTKLS